MRVCPFCVYGVSHKVWHCWQEYDPLWKSQSKLWNGILFKQGFVSEKIHIDDLSDMCAFIPDTDKPMDSDSLHHLKVN